MFSPHGVTYRGPHNTALFHCEVVIPSRCGQRSRNCEQIRVFLGMDNNKLDKTRINLPLVVLLQLLHVIKAGTYPSSIGCETGYIQDNDQLMSGLTLTHLQYVFHPHHKECRILVIQVWPSGPELYTELYTIVFSLFYFIFLKTGFSRSFSRATSNGKLFQIITSLYITDLYIA